MHELWSRQIQGIQTLYGSRSLRFQDGYRSQWTELFALPARKGLRILEVGCGPGALTGALCRWYPDAELVGLDRDSRFIAFARAQIPGATFCEGDATALPFPDSSFDVTISYTVSEHIAPDPFYGEQWRVLRDGGICLVLSCRKSIVCPAPCLAETDVEAAFWQSTGDDDTWARYGVGRYWQDERQMPVTMEHNRFAGISTGYVVVSLTPDNPSCPPDMAEAILDAQRAGALEAVLSTGRTDAGPVLDAIQAKYDRRLQLLRDGCRQWDTYTTLNLVLRGVRRADPCP